MGAEAGIFPDWTEADWRKAAEAALKGASLDKLVAKTSDGLRIEPVYQPATGPRALRAGGEWRLISRLDNPDPREAGAQAQDDLANGAEGQVGQGGVGFGGHALEPQPVDHGAGQGVTVGGRKAV